MLCSQHAWIVCWRENRRGRLRSRMQQDSVGCVAVIVCQWWHILRKICCSPCIVPLGRLCNWKAQDLIKGHEDVWWRCPVSNFKCLISRSKKKNCYDSLTLNSFDARNVSPLFAEVSRAAWTLLTMLTIKSFSVGSWIIENMNLKVCELVTGKTHLWILNKLLPLSRRDTILSA